MCLISVENLGRSLILLGWWWELVDDKNSLLGCDSGAMSVTTSPLLSSSTNANHRGTVVVDLYWCIETPPKNELGIVYSLRVISLMKKTWTMWWFQMFFMFTPTSGRFPFWLIFFRWVVQPPPRKCMIFFFAKMAWVPGQSQQVPVFFHGKFHHRNRSRWTVKRSFIGWSWTYGNWFGKPKKPVTI